MKTIDYYPPVKKPTSFCIKTVAKQFLLWTLIILILLSFIYIGGAKVVEYWFSDPPTPIPADQVKARFELIEKRLFGAVIVKSLGIDGFIISCRYELPYDGWRGYLRMKMDSQNANVFLHACRLRSDQTNHPKNRYITDHSPSENICRSWDAINNKRRGWVRLVIYDDTTPNSRFTEMEILYDATNGILYIHSEQPERNPK